MKKNVLITAGSKNTGFCIAETFAEKGYNVHITSRSFENAQEAAEKIKKKYPGISAFAYSLEMSEVDDIVRVFGEVRKNCSSLDVFVANAAQLGVGLDIFNTDEQSFNDIMNTNVRGTFFCCREAGRLMTKNGGSIVIMGSIQSKGAVKGRMVYSMSKAAINALCKSLAYDFAPYNIRVNCLVAGAIHTNRWENVDEEVLKGRRINYLTGKEAEMEEIANGVLYLSQDVARSITGTELVIDSGVSVPLLPYKDRKKFKREGF